MWWARGDAQELAEKKAAMDCVIIREVKKNDLNFRHRVGKATIPVPGCCGARLDSPKQLRMTRRE
jgi:hypothetical protein